MYWEGKGPTGSETREVFTVIWSKVFFWRYGLYLEGCHGNEKGV